MANVSVYRRLSDVLQGKGSRNRCVAGLVVSVARIPAVSLDLSSVDAIKTQHSNFGPTPVVKAGLKCRGLG
jgi:hypothetical protein